MFCPIGGAEYFVTVIDDASAYVRVFHTKTNGEAAGMLNRHVHWLESQTDRRVRKIVLDGGKEYAKDTKESESRGIKICATSTYTAEVSGKAGQMNQTVKKAVRTMWLYSGAPASSWEKCLYVVRDVRNCVDHKRHSERPEELLTGVKPSVAHIRALGCKAWIRVPDKTTKTLEAKDHSEILLRSITYEDC